MAALAAGIGAAGSVLSGITGGKGAKAAAKTQQQTVQMQIAASNANLAKITGLEQPTIDRGNAAGTTYAGLLGVGGDPAASAAALNTYRSSTGYQDLLNTGLGAVNSNAYARGLGDSSATLKDLQTKGMAIADQNQQQYLGNLNNLIQTGNSAIGNIAGVNTATTQANNAALQTGANASSNASLLQSSALQGALKNLTNIGSNLASSYGSSSVPTSAFPGLGQGGGYTIQGLQGGF
jgi:hypothetical protein